MTHVYLVSRGSYSEYQVMCVCAQQEHAERYCEQMNAPLLKEAIKEGRRRGAGTQHGDPWAMKFASPLAFAAERVQDYSGFHRVEQFEVEAEWPPKPKVETETELVPVDEPAGSEMMQGVQLLEKKPKRTFREVVGG